MRGNQFPSSNENINIQLQLSPLIFASRTAPSCGKMSWPESNRAWCRGWGIGEGSLGLVATKLQAPAGVPRAGANQMNLSFNVAVLSLEEAHLLR